MDIMLVRTRLEPRAGEARSSRYPFEEAILLDLIVGFVRLKLKQLLKRSFGLSQYKKTSFGVSKAFCLDLRFQPSNGDMKHIIFGT